MLTPATIPDQQYTKMPIKPEPKVEPVVEEAKPVVQPTPITPEPKPEVKPEPVKVEEPKVDPQKAPDWLFDDDDQKKAVEADGERYELDDETIIKLMVIGDKELRHNIVGRWDELDAYLGHPTLGDVVALLKDGAPFIVTNNVVVPARSLNEIAKLLDDSEDKIKLLMQDNFLMVDTGASVLTTRLLEGEFINYKQIIGIE